MGYSVNRTRIVATSVGGVLAGIGGSYLSLYYPGAWTESISSGQGLMAVALVIFARWNPINCLLASLLFGALARSAWRCKASTWPRLRRDTCGMRPRTF